MRMTEDQVNKAGAEAQRLYEMAKAQLVEHKSWLGDQVVKAWRSGMPQDRADALVNLIAEVDLSIVKPEPGIREEDGRPTISIVVKYPDELYDFLYGEDCPKELRSALAGGMTIDRKEGE